MIQPGKGPVRILHLDDSPIDAQLVRMTLEAAGNELPSRVTYVETRKEFLEAMEHQEFDIILSDWRLPDYTGDDALVDARRLCPDTPFIMVTGEMGEDRAIETLHRGASDYVLKANMIRLVPAVERALAEAENRRKRREAEERLRASEDRYRRLVDHIHDALLVDDIEGRVVFANDKFLRLFGLEQEDLAAMTLEDYVAPEYQQELRERHEGRMRGEKVPTQFIYRGLRKDGTPLWVEVSVVPLFEQGRIIGTESVIRDITERVLTEEALRLSEERFSAAFSMSPYPQAISRLADGVFLDVNNAWLIMTGRSREETIGRSSFELGMLVDPRERREMVNILRQEGTVRDFTLHIKTRTQGERQLLASSCLLQGDREQAMLTVAIDVTERLRAERELRKANERLEAILQGAGDSLIIFDSKLRFTHISKAGAESFRSFGRDPEALLGKVVWEEFSEYMGSTAQSKTLEVIRRRKRALFELQFGGRWFDLRCVPTADGGMAVLSLDITERKQREERRPENGKR